MKYKLKASTALRIPVKPATRTKKL